MDTEEPKLACVLTDASCCAGGLCLGEDVFFATAEQTVKFRLPLSVGEVYLVKISCDEPLSADGKSSVVTSRFFDKDNVVRVIATSKIKRRPKPSKL